MTHSLTNQSCHAAYSFLYSAAYSCSLVTLCQDAVSQSLCGSADLGHLGFAPGDGFPYHCNSTLECHEPGQFQWFGPEDGPRDDPDDPGNDNDNNEFVDTTDELDPSLAVFQNLAIAVNHLSCSSHWTNDSSSSHAKVHELDTFNSMDPKKLRTFLVQCELCFQD